MRRERPILFSAPMVRAILAGRKTQTRRIVRPQPAALCRYEMNGAGTHALHFGPPRHPGEMMCLVPPTPTSKDHRLPCPYVGGGLWVRETWTHDADSDAEARSQHEDAMCMSPVYYRAGMTKDEADTLEWRSPIFMPRWASRIALEVTEVRVQRIQEISEEDARAEGVRPGDAGDPDLGGTARGAFHRLWDEINGKRAPWSSNPWVWVITFTVANNEEAAVAQGRAESETQE